jgi:ABC-2 type transport system ATP-binding protein
VTYGLEAIEVSRSYRRGRKALDGVTLAVPRGRAAALIGPNGAGKTTLIRCWAGFERPSGGRLFVLGRPPEAGRDGVAIVAQNPSLYRSLTVGEHIALAVHTRTGFEPKLARARLDRLGIGPEERVDRLSGGQRAQVALSLAVGLRAEVLLLDEPVASLDPLSRVAFLGEIAALRAETGVTVLLSSHVVGELDSACDWIVLLSGGRVILSEDRAALLARHVVSDLPLAGGTVGMPIPGADGAALTFVQPGRDGGSASRPARLDDVVIAYMAANP